MLVFGSKMVKMVNFYVIRTSLVIITSFWNLNKNLIVSMDMVSWNWGKNTTTNGLRGGQRSAIAGIRLKIG